MAVARKQLHRSGVSLSNRKELMAQNTATQEKVDEAVAVVNRSLTSLGIRAKSSTMASVLLSRCHYHVPTSAVPTAAVSLMADRTAMLLYNPEFILSLEGQGVEFVLAHEARHVIMRHLFTEPHLSADPVFELAIEACINHAVMHRLDVTKMPTAISPVVDKKGAVTSESRPTGIDPRELFTKYAADLKGQGLAPASFQDFIRTDFGCYSELKRMKNPPEAGSTSGECIHQGEGSGDDENGTSTGIDSEAASELAKEVLAAVARAAMSGKSDAKNELLELADRTENASERTRKIWGDLGLGRLRGRTAQSRRVDWWKRWATNAIASKLQPGERLIYPKKRAVIDAVLRLKPILLRRGDEDVKVVYIALDTSGSMPQHVIDWLTQLVGHTDGLEMHWLSFDGVVTPFKAGEKVSGGGGTNFGNVMDFIEGRTEVAGQRVDMHPDLVVVLTDGYAPPISPAEPDKWMWLITENGDDGWIRNQNPQMDSYKLQTGEGLT